MSYDVLIRNLPDDLKTWIEKKRIFHRMSQQEFLIKLIERAAKEPQISLLNDQIISVPTNKNAIPFTFIDLFAGIGGFRIALEELGGSCVFTSEWDRYAQKTYYEWFGDMPVGDIREIDPSSIPNHDILAAGFPCQPFSIAGVSKKKSLGREHGFKDKSQGNLFFYLAEIIKAKRPPVAILENVKNLKSHDKGNTWRVINSMLEELEYKVFHKIIDARHWVPQHRERIFIVCFDKRVFGNEMMFSFDPLPDARDIKFMDILEKDPSEKYYLSTKLWNYLKAYAEKHKRKGNGFGYGMTDLNGFSRTLSARYYKDGSEVLIPTDKSTPRKLTPREAANLMGFPEYLPIVVSDTQAYRQFGNAVVPPVVKFVGQKVISVIAGHLKSIKNYCLVKR